MTTTPLRLGFIVEEAYRRSRMPSAVAAELEASGHIVTLIEPQRSLTSVGDVAAQRFDGVILRTLSGGPGLDLLIAYAAAGTTTVNDAAAVTRVRNKLAMTATARARGIPVPDTYFATDPRLLDELPDGCFPLVVKPSDGGFGRAVRLLEDRAALASLQAEPSTSCGLLAQPWVRNSGYDLKLYSTGQGVHAVRRRSSLMGGLDGERERIDVSASMAELARRIGAAFDLEVYGADIVEGAEGLVVVDVNDFPSFGTISEAPREVAVTIAGIVRSRRAQGSAW